MTTMINEDRVVYALTLAIESKFDEGANTYKRRVIIDLNHRKEIDPHQNIRFPKK